MSHAHNEKSRNETGPIGDLFEAASLPRVVRWMGCAGSPFIGRRGCYPLQA